MTDLLRTASDWLGGMFKKHASQSVVYSRGTDRVEWMATVGESEWDVTNTRGIVERIESRDFIGDAADLALSTGQATPQRDDQIRELIGSTTYVYQVMSPSADVDCWEYADQFRRRIRVHTKLIGTEP